MCPNNKQHQGVRLRETTDGRYILYCFECGQDIKEVPVFRGSHNMSLGKYL